MIMPEKLEKLINRYEVIDYRSINRTQARAILAPHGI